MNDETGDKMELYKCFMCGVAFPSVSRLQGHLSQHKQQFVCCKCSFSCDSRVQFSYHVQREHLSPVVQSRRWATYNFLEPYFTILFKNKCFTVILIRF